MFDWVWKVTCSALELYTIEFFTESPYLLERSKLMYFRAIGHLISVFMSFKVPPMEKSSS